MAVAKKESTMEETSTWAVAAVCFVLLAISIFIEHIIHAIGKVSCSALLLTVSVFVCVV
jgi:mlo protein